MVGNSASRANGAENIVDDRYPANANDVLLIWMHPILLFYICLLFIFFKKIIIFVFFICFFLYLFLFYICQRHMDASHPVIIVIAMQSLIAKLSVLLLSFEMTPKTVIPIITIIKDSQIFEKNYTKKINLEVESI